MDLVHVEGEGLVLSLSLLDDACIVVERRRLRTHMVNPFGSSAISVSMECNEFCCFSDMSRFGILRILFCSWVIMIDIG